MKTVTRMWAVAAAVALASITGCTPGSGTTSTQPAAGSPTPSAGGSTQAGAAVIIIRNFKYEVPDSVKPGSMVTVTNTDSAPHTLTAKDKGGFDVEVHAGETVIFSAPDSPGRYAFVCTFHPQMTGTLVVK